MTTMILVAILVAAAVGALATIVVVRFLDRRAPSEKSDRMREQFQALAAESLRANSEQFLQLAQENLQRHHQQAKAELDTKEKAIETMVKPISEALKKTSEQIEALERDRRQSHGAISEHLRSMQEAQLALQSETRNLVKALRKPEVRGRYGEMTLRRIAELAGMVEHCDFYEQEQTADNRRPDMVVRMPEGRELVIDAKTVITAYLDAIEAGDDATRDAHLVRHLALVKEQIKNLSSKAYWSQFERSPDFVVMFLPGEQFLEPALKLDPDLQDDALQKKVVIATPTSLVALMKVIAYGWREQKLAENAAEIHRLGEQLHGRLATFAEHLSSLGKSLGRSIEHYNKAVGSFEHQLVPGVRRFPEMGVRSGKELPQLDPLDHTPRRLDPVPDDDDDD